MREIKFRAWDKDLQKMLWPKYVGNGEIADESCVRVRGQVELMQFTGLKDKNGKEIYEGDILEDKKNHSPIPVFWHLESACFYAGRPTNKFPLDVLGGSEVIGNIHENQELIPK